MNMIKKQNAWSSKSHDETPYCSCWQLYDVWPSGTPAIPSIIPSSSKSRALTAMGTVPYYSGCVAILYGYGVQPYHLLHLSLVSHCCILYPICFTHPTLSVAPLSSIPSVAPYLTLSVAPYLTLSVAPLPTLSVAPLPTSSVAPIPQVSCQLHPISHCLFTFL